MDWNAKTPSQWDYESLEPLNSNVGEMPRLTQSSEWGVENGSIYSSGGGVCSGSEVGNGCSSKSSFSASIDSVPRARPRSTIISFDTASKDAGKKELGRVKDIRNTPELTGSVGSVEPLIGLKLGKRTYFEDFHTENNTENLSFPGVPVPSSITTKKTRVSNQNQNSQKSRCQVEGCNVDLTTAKSYHRKHRVCESHSKCAMVIVAGQERRFCQQCSRFHGLSEFDQKKRSCRRRLHNHNARRRKPPPHAISHDSARVSSSLYDDRQQMNLLVNRSPYAHVRPESSTWESSCNFSLTQANGTFIRSSKAGSIGGQLYLPNSELPMISSTLHHDLDRLLPFKSTAAEVLNQGLEATVVASNLDGAPDFRRALSLLSTDSGVSSHPRCTSINQLLHENHATSTQTAVQVVHPNPDNWQAAQSMPQETGVCPFPLHSDGSQFQGFQLLKEPCGTAFFNSNQIN